MDSLDRPGIRLYAGMAGVLVGFDVVNALAGMPRGLDHELTKRLLVAAEVSFIAAAHKSDKEP